MWVAHSKKAKEVGEGLFVHGTGGRIRDLGHYPCTPGSNAFLKGCSERKDQSETNRCRKASQQVIEACLPKVQAKK